MLENREGQSPSAEYATVATVSAVVHKDPALAGHMRCDARYTSVICVFDFALETSIVPIFVTPSIDDRFWCALLDAQRRRRSKNLLATIFMS